MPHKMSQEHQKIIRKEFPVEVERVSIHIPVTSSEVESNVQNQQNIELESDEEIVEDNSIDQNPLADYQLTRDGEKSLYREPQRMSSTAIAYTSYQELVDKKSSTYEEAMRSEKCEKWLDAMREEMSSLTKNLTQNLVPRFNDKSIIR